MADRTENSRINIFIDNAQANAALKQLGDEYKKLRDAQKKMEIGSKEWLAQQAKIDGVNRQMHEFRSKIDLSVLSMKQLQTHLDKLRGIRNHLVPGTQEFKNISKEIQTAQARLISLRNEGIGAFNKLTNAVKGWGATALAAFSATAIFSFFKSSLHEFEKQEEANKKLEVALGRTSKALLDQASALQKKTKFADDDIINAQAQFAALVKNEDQIKELTRVTLDYAAATGTDLDSATKIMVKSIGMGGHALAKLGIVVDDSAHSMHGHAEATKKVATAAENADVVIKHFTEHYKGQAEAAAQVGSGPLKQLENAWSDLKETFGSVVAAGFVPIAKGLMDLTNAANEFLNPTNAISEQYEKQKELVKGLNQNILPLITEYEDLQGKTNLTREEQNRLNDILLTLKENVPVTAQEFDKYGNVIGVNTDKAKEYIKQQERILELRTQDEFEKQITALKKLSAEYNAQKEIRDKIIRASNDEIKMVGINVDASGNAIKKNQEQINALAKEETEKFEATKTKIADVLTNIETLGRTIDGNKTTIMQGFGGKGELENLDQLAKKIDFVTVKQNEAADAAKKAAALKAAEDAKKKAEETEAEEKLADKKWKIWAANEDRRIALLQDGLEKEIALENQKYEVELREAKKNGEDVELLEQLHQKRIADIKKNFQDKLLEMQQKHFENDVALMDEGAKKKFAQEQIVFNKELLDLKKQIITKEKLTAEELAFNDEVYRLIEQAGLKHAKRMQDLIEQSRIKPMDLPENPEMIVSYDAEQDVDKYNKKKKKDEEYQKQLTELQEDNAKLAADTSIDIAKTLADTRYNIMRNEIERESELKIASINNQRDAAIKSLDSQMEQELKKKGLTEEQKESIRIEYEKRKEDLDKQYQEKELQVKKEAFEKNKDLQKKQARMTFALELLNIAAQAAANPTNALTFGAAGLIQYGILAAAAAVRYGTQVAQINAQQFTYGGSLPGRSSGKDTLTILDEQGHPIAKAHRGEVLIPEDTAKANPEAINALLGNKGKRIVGDPFAPVAQFNVSRSASTVRMEKGGFLDDGNSSNSNNFSQKSTPVNVNVPDNEKLFREMISEFRGLRNDFKTIKFKTEFSLREMKEAEDDKTMIADLNNIK